MRVLATMLARAQCLDTFPDLRGQYDDQYAAWRQPNAALISTLEADPRYQDFRRRTAAEGREDSGNPYVQAQCDAFLRRLF